MFVNYDSRVSDFQATSMVIYNHRVNEQVIGRFSIKKLVIGSIVSQEMSLLMIHQVFLKAPGV